MSGSIYAASEGLRTLVIEQEVPGGQITYSAIVENYPGFPVGLTGSDLAGRTVAQAERFGVDILVMRRAVELAEQVGRGGHVLVLDAHDDVAQDPRPHRVAVHAAQPSGSDSPMMMGVRFSSGNSAIIAKPSWSVRRCAAMPICTRPSTARGAPFA